jgi:hypothetical protein
MLFPNIHIGICVMSTISILNMAQTFQNYKQHNLELNLVELKYKMSLVAHSPGCQRPNCVKYVFLLKQGQMFLPSVRDLCTLHKRKTKSKYQTFPSRLYIIKDSKHVVSPLSFDAHMSGKLVNVMEEKKKTRRAYSVLQPDSQKYRL